MHIKVGHWQGASSAGADLRVGRSIKMFDLIMLAIGVGFFALSVAYAHVCDQL